MELLKNNLQKVIPETLTDKSYCQNCSVCYAWQELFLDYVLERESNLLVVDDKIFSFKNKNKKIAHKPLIYKNRFYVTNSAMKYLSAAYLQKKNLEIEPCIYFAAQCGFEYKQLKYSTHTNFTFDPYDMIKKILGIYFLTEEDKFLHGDPDIKNIVSSYDDVLKLKTSENSTFIHEGNYLSKSHPELSHNICIKEDGDFFQIKVDKFYGRFSEEFYSYLRNMEFYLWTISIMRAENKSYSKEWVEYFRSLWKPEEYINVLLEIDSDSTDFEIVSKFSIRKELPK